MKRIYTAEEVDRAASSYREKQTPMHTLKFPAYRVAELVAHAKAAKKHRPYYEDMGVEKDNPYICLVGDAGVYLMSGGEPHMKIHGAEKAHHRVVYAEGLDPHLDDGWWERKSALKTRGDFGLRIPLRKLPPVLDHDTNGWIEVRWPEGQDCMIFGPDEFSVHLV